jgi:hypothetical protein
VIPQPNPGLRPELDARVRLRGVLEIAVALGVDRDPEGSVAAAAARSLLRAGSRDVDRVDTWAGVLALWAAARTEDGLL